MKTGIELIADERARQISAEGWTEENDNRYESGELIDAAASYVHAARMRTRGENGVFLCGLASAGSVPWPWEDHWWKPTEDNDRNLAKAGALIAAELDRRQRTHVCRRCGGMEWVPSNTEADTDPCPVCAFPQNIYSPDK